MSTKPVLIYIAAIMVITAGCAKIEESRSYEDSGPNLKTYKSIGILEVKEPAQELTNQKGAWFGVEVATLSLAPTPSAGDLYKARLKAKLAHVAKERYGADAVVNVTFWPDPDSGNFPDGLIHARGDMVRYKKFPAPEPATAA